VTMTYIYGHNGLDFWVSEKKPNVKMKCG